MTGQSRSLAGRICWTHDIAAVNGSICCCVFATSLGWMGIAGHDQTVLATTIGHPAADAALRALAALLLPQQKTSRQDKPFRQQQKSCTSFPLPSPTDWFPELRRRLMDYTRGHKDDFRDVSLRLPAATPFQRAVLQTTRAIPFGEQRTYSEVAAAAGSPRAARAVGNLMAANRVPLLIPCHRVVGANGSAGGFSAPQGIALKKRLLKLEAESAQTAIPASVPPG